MPELTPQPKKDESRSVSPAEIQSDVVGEPESATGSARKFGISMLLAGAACTVLPFFGLQLKQFGENGMVGTIGTGLVLLVVGGISLIVSRSRGTAKVATSGLKGVMWGIIGLGVTLILGIVGFFGYGYVRYVLLAPQSPHEMVEKKIKPLQGAEFERAVLEIFNKVDASEIERDALLNLLRKRAADRPSDEIARKLLALFDSDLRNRAAIVESLGNWGTENTYSEILARCKQTDIHPQTAHHILTEIGRRIPNAQGVIKEDDLDVELSLAWISTDLDAPQMENRLQFLADSRSAKPNAELTNLLKKKLDKFGKGNKKFEMAVFKAWGVIGTNDCIKILTLVSKKHNDPDVKKTAADALEKVRARNKEEEAMRRTLSRKHQQAV